MSARTANTTETTARARLEFVRVVRLLRHWYFLHRNNRVEIEEVINGVNRRFIMPSIHDLSDDFMTFHIPEERVRYIRDYWNDLFIQGGCTWSEKRRAIHVTMQFVHYSLRYEAFMVEI
jgi:hypothetical protein